jgi:hypothetical protein
MGNYEFRKRYGQMPEYKKKNPSDGLDTRTILMLGMGTALLGAIVYAIYQIGQTQNALNDTNAQIAQGASSAQSVSDQIAAASQSAQNVSDQIYNANQTVQTFQQSPAYQAANQGAAWWNQ